jgi:hypothetical protein
LHRRATSVVSWWEAAFGSGRREARGFGHSNRTPPRKFPSGLHSFGRGIQRGVSSRESRFRPKGPLRGGATSRASARELAKLGAICSRARRLSGQRVESSGGFGLRANQRKHPSLRAIRLRRCKGLAPVDGDGDPATRFRASDSEPGAQSSGSSRTVTLPRAKLLTARLLRESRLAAAVILCSGAQEQGRSNVNDACIGDAQLEDRNTSRLIPS